MKTSHVVTALLPAALLVCAGAAAAQSTVQAGQTVSGRLEASDSRMDDDSYFDLWRYRGKRGERLTVTLRSGHFDAYLAFGRMEAGRFVPLDADDDGAGGTDSRLEVTLPDEGEYAIRANTLFGGKTGAYTLQVEPGGTAPSTPVRTRSDDPLGAIHSSGRIRAGQTVSGALDASDPVTFDDTHYDDWIYEGKRGERLTLTLRSGAFDSYLQFGRLVNGKFSYIGAQDDGAGGNDSLMAVTLEEDGEYVLRVNTLFDATGPYTLRVESDRP